MSRSISGVGIGQTWQTVVRSSGVSVQNTTGKPIVFAMAYSNDGAGAGSLVEVSVDNVTFFKASQNYAASGGEIAGASAVVPANHYYRPTFSGALVFQSELR